MVPQPEHDVVLGKLHGPGIGNVQQNYNNDINVTSYNKAQQYSGHVLILTHHVWSELNRASQQTVKLSTDNWASSWAVWKNLTV